MGTGLVFVVIPLMMAVIGIVTKWVAIKLIFHPERWVGIGPIGWQGIVQRRAPKFAAGIADTVLQAGLGVETLIDRIDPEEFAALLGPMIEDEAPTTLPALAEAVKPGLWEEMAPPARDAITQQLQAEGRRLASALVTELKPVLAESIDLQGMIVAELSGENANRLARLVLRVAGRDLNIVIGYGGILGFLLGLVGAVGYVFFERWWLMPFVGALDGVVNNWLAIQMIFRPKERTRYLGIFPYQGLFHARKEEIAHEYSGMLAEEVLTPETIFAHLAASPNAARLFQVGLATLERELESSLDMAASLLGVEVEASAQARVMGALTASLQSALPRALPEIQEYLSKRLEVAATLENALVSLSPDEFETVLRSIFTEDEKTIIIVGGVLGALIGLGQAAVVLAVTGA